MKYVPDVVKNREAVREILISNENFYKKIPQNLQEDLSLLLDVVKENVLIMNYIDSRLFNEENCMAFIEKNFQAYVTVKNFLSLEKQKEALDYLCLSKYKNVFFNISLEDVSLKQSRKLVRNHARYYAKLPQKHMEDFSIICKTIKQLNNNNIIIFDKNFIREKVCAILSEKFIKEEITPLQFLKKYKEEVDWNTWLSILSYKPLMDELSERNIDVLDANFNYQNFLREILLKDKLENQKISTKIESVKKKI